MFTLCSNSVYFGMVIATILFTLYIGLQTYWQSIEVKTKHMGNMDLKELEMIYFGYVILGEEKH